VILTQSASGGATLGVLTPAAAALREKIGDSSIEQVFAVDPSGRFLVTGTWRTLARVWDIASGELRHELSHGDRIISSMTITPDGTQLFLGLADGSVQVWNLRSGDLLDQFADNNGTAITALHCVAGGSGLLAVHAQGAASLWQLTNRPSRVALPGLTDGISAAAVSADSSQIATVSRDSYLRIWQAENGDLVTGTQLGNGYVGKIAYSDSGDRLVLIRREHLTSTSLETSGTRIVMDVVDPETGALLVQQELTQRPISNLVMDSRAHYIAGSDGKEILVWRTDPAALAGRYRGHEKDVTALAFVGDGQTLASGSSDRSIRIWNIVAPPATYSMSEGTGTRTLGSTAGRRGDDVYDVALSQAGSRAATVHRDGPMTIWDTSSGATLSVLPDWAEDYFIVALQPGGHSIGVSSGDNTVDIFDLQSGEVLMSFNELAGPTELLRFSPSGRLLAVGSQSGSINVWDMYSGDRIAELSVGDRRLPAGTVTVQNYVQGIAFSADESFIAAASSEHIVVDRLSFNTAPLVLEDPGSGISTLALDPSGEQLAIGRTSGDITIRSLSSNGPQSELTGHENRVNDLLYTADGSRLISGSSDETVRIWDPDHGHSLLVLRAASHAILDLAFDPEYGRVVAISESGIVQIYQSH